MNVILYYEKDKVGSVSDVNENPENTYVSK